MKHHVERTSPKGGPFIGTCRLCGKPNLPASAALEDCENVRGLSAEEALIETILGQDRDQYEKELREAIKGGPAVGLTPAEMAAFLSRKADDASSRPQ